jgi:hypothetical protein
MQGSKANIVQVQFFKSLGRKRHRMGGIISFFKCQFQPYAIANLLLNVYSLNRAKSCRRLSSSVGERSIELLVKIREMLTLLLECAVIACEDHLQDAALSSVGWIGVLKLRHAQRQVIVGLVEGVQNGFGI